MIGRDAAGIKVKNSLSLAVNSPRVVNLEKHREILWANIPFSFHLEVGVQKNDSKHSFLSFPFEINLLFMMPQSTSAQLHQERRLEVGIFVVKKKCLVMSQIMRPKRFQNYVHVIGKQLEPIL